MIARLLLATLLILLPLPGLAEVSIGTGGGGATDCTAYPAGACKQIADDDEDGDIGPEFQQALTELVWPGAPGDPTPTTESRVFLIGPGAGTYTFHNPITVCADSSPPDPANAGAAAGQPDCTGTGHAMPRIVFVSGFGRDVIFKCSMEPGNPNADFQHPFSGDGNTRGCWESGDPNDGPSAAGAIIEYETVGENWLTLQTETGDMTTLIAQHLWLGTARGYPFKLRLLQNTGNVAEATTHRLGTLWGAGDIVLEQQDQRALTSNASLAAIIGFQDVALSGSANTIFGVCPALTGASVDTDLQAAAVCSAPSIGLVEGSVTIGADFVATGRARIDFNGPSGPLRSFATIRKTANGPCSDARFNSYSSLEIGGVCENRGTGCIWQPADPVGGPLIVNQACIKREQSGGTQDKDFLRENGVGQGPVFWGPQAYFSRDAFYTTGAAYWWPDENANGNVRPYMTSWKMEPPVEVEIAAVSTQSSDLCIALDGTYQSCANAATELFVSGEYDSVVSRVEALYLGAMADACDLDVLSDGVAINSQTGDELATASAGDRDRVHAFRIPAGETVQVRVNFSEAGCDDLPDIRWRVEYFHWWDSIGSFDAPAL